MPDRKPELWEPSASVTVVISAEVAPNARPSIIRCCLSRVSASCSRGGSGLPSRPIPFVEIAAPAPCGKAALRSASARSFQQEIKPGRPCRRSSRLP
jgi:hypothetical protein